MGKLSPLAEVNLDEDEKIYAQAGTLMYKTPSVEMKPTGQKSGISGIFKRILTSESLLFVEFTGPGTVGISPYFPGEIKEIYLEEGESIHVNKGAFLFAESTVSFDIDWISFNWLNRIKLGLLGGEGFFFQRLTGPGRIFLYVCGNIISTELDENTRLQIEQGALVYKDINVIYDITRVKGWKKIFFSGTGFFLGTLKGPGKVALQTLDYSRFAGKIVSPFLKS